jgi:hypothetical protein
VGYRYAGTLRTLVIPRGRPVFEVVVESGLAECRVVDN